MNVPRRVGWVALMTVAGVAACHNSPAPGREPYPRDGAYDFRMLGLTPPVKGRLTIVDGQFYIDVTSARCVNFPPIRRNSLPLESIGFECRGVPTFSRVDIVISRRDPVRYSTWYATGSSNEQTTTSQGDCLQYAVNARGQKVCLSYRTVTRTTGGNQTGRLEVVPRPPRGGNG